MRKYICIAKLLSAGEDLLEKKVGRRDFSWKRRNGLLHVHMRFSSSCFIFVMLVCALCFLLSRHYDGAAHFLLFDLAQGRSK
jgi:hypothetical protein